MQWLIANMWMALAAATFLGLLFGFSFRGLLVSARIRKANVEREIAKTELSQTKAEVEALYAAQRKRKEDNAQSVGGDEQLQAELEERESRIVTLGEELDAARAELDQLKAAQSESDDGAIAGVATAAAAGAVAGAALTDGDSAELTELRDRNTWLEERVASLEADLSAMPAPAASAEAAPDPEPADIADATHAEKLAWQAAFLRQRVDALEDKVIALNDTAQVAAVERAPAPSVAATEPVEVADTASKETEEELARLRWRNRYLEGRLAYFEESESQTQEDEVAEQPNDEQVAETSPEVVPSEPENDPSSEATDAPETPENADAAEDAELVATDDDVHPSEAMLAELEGVRPEQVSKPDSGGDDLTAISGIGPRIAEVLNELGIWTYAQIANWNADNATWIENHLSFKGRVGREDWVNQAKALAA